MKLCSVRSSLNILHYQELLCRESLLRSFICHLLVYLSDPEPTHILYQLAGYVLLVKGHRLGQGAPYLALNIIGSSLVAINLAQARAWPGAVLQVVFICINLYGVRELRRKQATIQLPSKD